MNDSDARSFANQDTLARGWFKSVRSADALELIRANPLAFVLAYIIAARAKWRDGFSRHDLNFGEAFIGDFESYGMSERNYRTAKHVLSKWQFASFKATSKGTIASLIDSRLFEVIRPTPDGQGGGRQTDKATDARRLTKNEERRTVERKSEVEVEESALASLKMNSKTARTVELLERCKSVLGESEMNKAHCHKLWLNRATAQPDKLRRVLEDTVRAAKDGEIRTSPAQYAQHRWKEFAP